MKFRLVHQIIIVTLFRLLLNTGRRFIYPFAPALSRGLDVPLTAVTTIIATSQVSSLLGVFSGPMADRIGYRRMMQAGMAMLAIGMFACGLFPVYWVVFAGLVLASFGKTVFDPAVLAFIGQNVPYARRARSIGAVESSWAGSTLIGIPLLGVMLQNTGLNSTFYLLAVLGIVAWAGIRMVIPADVVRPVSERGSISIAGSLAKLLRIRPAAGMVAFGFWISIANDNLFVVYGVWFEQDFNVSIVTLGFSAVAIGAAELLGEFMTAVFSDWFGLRRSIIAGLLLSIIAYLLLPLIGFSFSLAMVGMFLVFFTFEFTIVTCISLCTELMPESRATMLSGLYAASGIGRMVGVLAGGILWKYGGIAGVAWTSAGLTVVALLSLAWGLHGWQPQRDA